MTLQINTNANSINWQLGQELSDQDIINQLNLTVTQNGQAISNDHVSINKKAVNPNTAGVYTIVITAVGPNNDYTTKEIQAWVKTYNTPSAATQNRPTQNTPKKKKKTVWIVLGIIVLLFLIFFGISACQAHNDEVQNQQAQTSALNSANSKLDDLSEQNKELQNQTSALKKAVNQYKQDNDKQALQNQLDNLKEQNEQLKNNAANNQSLQNQISQLGSAIDQIKNNPNQADNAINEIKNNQNQFLQSLQNAFQKMINDIEQLFGK